MILAEDVEFHPHPATDHTWTETIGYWFAAPDANIYGNIYVLARPVVGATISSINVVQGLNNLAFEADFTDPQMHVPCPPSIAEFQLTSGLQVSTPQRPNGYDFLYKSFGGVCEIDLKLRGSMPAWDPNDPAENPLLNIQTGPKDLGLGDAWAGGHMDFIGRSTGHITLRGQRHEVNAMSGIDRSWGTRTELGEAAIAYLHIPFGDDLGLHIVTGIDLVDGEVQYVPLRFGYVYDSEGVHGLVDVDMTGVQKDLLPSTVEITATDDRGRVFRIAGRAVASAPWYTFSPTYVAMQALMRWEMDGREGFGLMSDTYGIEYLAKRTSRHGRAAVAAAKAASR